MCIRDRISPYYPQDLSHIFDPPPVLFVKGNPDGLTMPKNIAIVGSRRCTHYGLEVAEKLACELGHLGISIVSGMARGIDTSAHKGCLAAGGVTIAVLGCGVDVIYPPENNRVYEPVSYTHLDVYKRQPHGSAERLIVRARGTDEDPIDAWLMGDDAQAP